MPLFLRRDRRRLKEKLIHRLLFLSALVPIITTAGIILSLLVGMVEFFQKVSIMEFFGDLRWTPLFSPQHFGIWPLINGTLLVSIIGILVAVPLGLGSAIFLSEYAPLLLRQIIKPILEILAGVPTVVYGYFALVFVTPQLQKLFPQMTIFNALSAGIVMGIMILPLVSSLSEDALRAVPQSLREGAYALGATKLEITLLVVVPAAFSGIVAAFLLALSRAIGETMIVTIAAGATPKLTLNPLESIQTMTAYIAQISLGETPWGTVEYVSIFAVGGVLFLITFGINYLGRWVVHRFGVHY